MSVSTFFYVLSHNAIRSTHPKGEGSVKFIPVLQMYGSTMPVKASIRNLALGDVVSNDNQSFMLYYHICTRLCTWI